MNQSVNIKQIFFGNIRLVVGVVIVLVIIGTGWYIFSNAKPTLGSYTVGTGNIVASVDVPGSVSSSNSVDLSFQESGQIATVYVKEGQAVTQGETLASLDSSAQQTQLSQEQATLAGAQANYQKLLAGATTQNVQASKDAVTSAQQSLTNAYSGAINTLTGAYTTIYNAYTAVNTLENSYFTGADQPSFTVQDNEATINSDVADAKNNITIVQGSTNDVDTDTAIIKIISDLNDTYNSLAIIRQQCDVGTYYSTIPAASKASIDTQKTNVNTVLTAVTSLQSTLASDKIALQQAQDQLNVTTAPPTQADINLAKAQVTSAQAQIQNAQLAIDNAAIVAPFSGMIWNVVAEPGMVVSPNVPVLSIINNGILKFDAYAPQTDIPQLQSNALATVSLDAYGNGVTFPAKVTAVDTAQTIINGSPAYHVTLYFTGSDDRVRAGMTGNVLIMAGERDNVVEVPSRLVLNNGDNNFVLIPNGNKSVMRQITIGLTGNNGMVEVVSGLNAGEKISDF